MTPTNIPCPQFLTKWWWWHMALRALPVARSLRQFAPSLPNSAVHLQQSCKKDVSKVSFYCCRPCNCHFIITVGDVEEEFQKLDGDGTVSPSSSSSRHHQRHLRPYDNQQQMWTLALMGKNHVTEERGEGFVLLFVLCKQGDGISQVVGGHLDCHL